MDDSSENSMVKIAVALIAVCMLLSAAAGLWSFYNTKIKDVQNKEIEHRKRQNQSISFIVPDSVPNDVLL